MMEGHESDKKDVRRPMNAFLIFCKRHRSMVREKNPELDNRSVTRILGDLWANLAEEKKSVYTTLAKQYKDAFMKANPDYKWHNPDKIHQPPAKMATRPTNARVIKNEVEINLDGSIVPGKLADPSKMGGLSLLLMAGQQSMPNKPDGIARERHDSEPLISPTDDGPGGSKSALLELAEMCASELEHDPEEVGKHQTNDIKNLTIQTMQEARLKSPKPTQLTPDYSFPPHYTSNISDLEPIDLSLKPVKNHPKTDFTSIKPASAITKPPVKEETMPAEVKHKLVELMKTTRDIIPVADAKIKFEGKDEKDCIKIERDHQKVSRNGSSDSDQNDNDIVNCGKMMVDHIIDKLYLAQSENTELNQKPNKMDAVSMDTTMNLKEEKDEKFDSAQLSDERCEDDGSDKDGGLKRHLDMESQENDDFVPVRKSRRRNRGQRYQELINEGIIQPSKERLAARKAAKTVPEEEIEEYEEFMPVEEVVEKKPTRKRMISEGDDGEDLKKYKTGDFDLEAHIADLPACSLEQVSKGKKTARARHLSESSIRKPPAPIATKEESTSCLPPHVKLKPANQQPPENIVGSRRRKFRKHSITHLIPANSVKDIPQSVTAPNTAKVVMPEICSGRSNSLDMKAYSDRNESATKYDIDAYLKEKISTDTTCNTSEHFNTGDVTKLTVNENCESSEKSENDKSNEGSKLDLAIMPTEKETLSAGEGTYVQTAKCIEVQDKMLSTSSKREKSECKDNVKSSVQDKISLIPNAEIGDKLEIPKFSETGISKTENEEVSKGEDLDLTMNDSSAKKTDGGFTNVCSNEIAECEKKSELFPLKEAEPVLSANALRMDILATEIKGEDTSIQCQGSPTVAAVHS